MKTIFSIRKRFFHGSQRAGQSHADRRIGQSTVELALMLPILAGLLYLIVFAFRTNHTANEQTTATYAERILRFNHGNGEIYDPDNGFIKIGTGIYSEHIPPDALIDMSELAKIVAGNLVQLGLGELFSHLHIFNDENFFGAFGEGFTYSLATSAATTFVETGSLHDMSASDLESAAWAGAASAFSSSDTEGTPDSADATEFFQGDDQFASTAREFFGSGLQAGLIGFSQSEGDWKAGVSSTFGGMMNSDTTKDFMDDGKAFEQIMKGAGKGAVQSSMNGVFSENFDAKSILVGAATGAVSTNAFAATLPFVGDDPTNSAMYGAFNGAFGTALSGGNLQTTLLAAGAGALGSQQVMSSMGKFGGQAASMGYGAGGSLISGQSLQAVGMGALTSAGAMGFGWGANQVSSFVSNLFNGDNTTDGVSSTLSKPETVEGYASDQTVQMSIDEILAAINAGMLDSEYLNSLFLQIGATS